MSVLRTFIVLLLTLLPSTVQAQMKCYGGVCEDMNPEPPIESYFYYLPPPPPPRPFRENIYGAVAVSSTGGIATSMDHDTLFDALFSAIKVCEEKHGEGTCSAHELSGRLCAGIVRGKNGTYSHNAFTKATAARLAMKDCKKARGKPCKVALRVCTAWLPPGFASQPVVRWYDETYQETER